MSVRWGLPHLICSQIKNCLNLIRGEGQHFSKHSEIQTNLNYQWGEGLIRNFPQFFCILILMPSLLNIGVCLNKVIFFKKIELFKYRVSRFTPLQTPLSAPVSESEVLTYPTFDRMILEQHIHICPSYPN